MNHGSIAPLIIAHRGARAYAPENTLAAFQKAAQLGADWVELDVQCTADAAVVVVHDDTLQRCSNVAEIFLNRTHDSVQSFTLAEIQSLDAGSWFDRELDRAPNERQPFLRSLLDDERRRYISKSDQSLYASGRVRHPTLVESLVQSRDLGLRVNVELKAPDTPAGAAANQVPDLLVDQVVQQIGELGLQDEVLISSFDHDSLRRVKRRDASLKTGVLVMHPISDPVAYCRQLNAAAYHPACLPDADAVGFDTDNYRATGRLDTELFRSLREAGIAVNVWTENNPVRMRQLRDAGATGIFTDYPNRALECIGDRGIRPRAHRI